MTAEAGAPPHICLCNDTHVFTHTNTHRNTQVKKSYVPRLMWLTDNRTDIQAPVPNFSAPTLRIFFSLQRKRCVLLYFSGKRGASLPVSIFKESCLYQTVVLFGKSIHEAKACKSCIFSAKGRRNTLETSALSHRKYS